MAIATIYDAAGDTADFFHETGAPREESATATRVTLSARILSGPFEGERATIAFLGTFNFANGTARVREMRESVDGELHFSMKLDRPADLEDLLFGDIDEPLVVRGNRFDNDFTATATADRLLGRAGDDRLRGAGGNDSLDGGNGRDDLAGGAGRDRLAGGFGADALAGGKGADLFIFRSAGEANRDVVADFGTGADRIDLRAIDADAGSAADDAFAFVGAAAFSGTAGELRFAGGRLLGDTDGDGFAEFRIEIAGDAPVAAGDVLL
jgi:Ca2+-binding RTX toxin-like protein